MGLWTSKKYPQARELRKLYRYQPLDSTLDEIRLLILQPGGSDAPIQCNLEHVSINSPYRPEYEAISCDSCEESLRSTIFVDGRVMGVSTSCTAILRRARLAHKTRALWIDAICVNHWDPAERSQQLEMMSWIYSHSRGNTIWLGGHDGTVEVWTALR